MSATVTVYEGTVRHRRLQPSVRQFQRRLYLAYVDVDALPECLDGIPGWSARRVAPVQFRRRDFLDGGSAPLGDAVRDLVEDRLGRRPTGEIRLLAQFRTFGWLFNPLSVYYCFRAGSAALDAVVLEVTNTPWGERQWYVVDALDNAQPPLPKSLHVSPFLPMDLDYHVSWTAPGADLRLAITVAGHGDAAFLAELVLRRRELDRRGAMSILVRHPMAPLRVSLAIYRKALGLLVAGTPVHRHPSHTTQEVHA